MKISPAYSLLGIVMLAVPGIAQTSQSDPQTLKEILSELRAIHNDVRLGQTTSILIAELQIQQTAVNSALQRRDMLRIEMSQLQSQEQAGNENLERLEGPASAADTTHEKDRAMMIAHFKDELAAVKIRKQTISPELDDAELHLRNEQSALDRIQNQLNDTVKKLQPVANP